MSRRAFRRHWWPLLLVILGASPLKAELISHRGRKNSISTEPSSLILFRERHHPKNNLSTPKAVELFRQR